MCFKIKSVIHLFIIDPPVNRMIEPDDEKIKDDWIGSVGRAIVRCSSTYVSKGPKTQGGNGGHASQANSEYHDDDSDYSNSSNNPYFND